MTLPRATVMLLVPGRRTLTFELDHRVPAALLAVLMCSALVGAMARRCFDPGFGDQRCVNARDLTGSLHALAWPETSNRRTFRGVRTVVPVPRAMPRPAPVRVTAPEPVRIRPLPQPTAPTGGLFLRVNALHLGESINVRAFDEAGVPQEQALAAFQHMMRCRISGEEVPIDSRLVRILAQISALYDRSIQLVSGHRKPHVLGTKPTSQHALGRAADIRVAGVGIEELRDVAIRLGARGVGLYPEKGFIHVDVREKPRYFWTYSEEEGEEADLRLIGATAALGRHASESESE